MLSTRNKNHFDLEKSTMAYCELFMTNCDIISTLHLSEKRFHFDFRQTLLIECYCRIIQY